MRNRVIAFGFAVTLLTFFVATIGLDDRIFSSMENRYLAQKPKLTAKTLFNGEYMESFETYMDDQIFAKDVLVTLKSDAEKLLQRKGSNGVFFGKHGRYIKDYEAEDKTLEDNLSFINAFAGEYKKDYNMVFFLAPNVQTVYPEDVSKSVVMRDAKADFDLVKKTLTNITVVDPTETLINNKEENLYFYTDHHWNMRGAYYGYQALSKEMAWDCKDLSEYDSEVVSEEFRGTLYSKAPLSFAKKDKIEVFTNTMGNYQVTFEDGKMLHSLFAKSNLYIKDKYTYFLDGNHPFITIKSNAGTKKKALVFKDSYSHAMLPFVADQYDEMDVVDLRYYRDDIKKLIQDGNYDDILLLYNLDFLATDDNLIELR